MDNMKLSLTDIQGPERYLSLQVQEKSRSGSVTWQRFKNAFHWFTNQNKCDRYVAETVLKKMLFKDNDFEKQQSVRLEGLSNIQLLKEGEIRELNDMLTKVIKGEKVGISSIDNRPYQKETAAAVACLFSYKQKQSSGISENRFVKNFNELHGTVIKHTQLFRGLKMLDLVAPEKEWGTRKAVVIEGASLDKNKPILNGTSDEITKAVIDTIDNGPDEGSLLLQLEKFKERDINDHDAEILASVIVKLKETNEEGLNVLLDKLRDYQVKNENLAVIFGKIEDHDLQKYCHDEIITHLSVDMKASPLRMIRRGQG